MDSRLTSTGLGYRYVLGDDYEPDLLTIDVTQIRMRSGSMYALLGTSTLINTARTIPNTNSVLIAECWLLSERSRKDYATALERLIPSQGGAVIDFSAILEQLAQMVVEAENTPVEVVSLRNTVIPTSPTLFLLEGLIPAGKPTILYGAGGVGKSILAATLAVCVQTGTGFLHMAARQREVLYLDWETDEVDIAARVQAAARGLKVPMPEVRYSSLVRPIEDRINQLAAYIADNEIGLVIIDSVGMAMNSAKDGSDASEGAIRFFRALRALDCAVLAIDHVSGDDIRRRATGAAKPYGSVYKWNSARNAFELRELRSPDSRGSHLTLVHRKSNLGPYMPEQHIRLEWTNSGAFFYPEAMAAPTTRAPLTEQILDVLATGPATANRLADLLSDEEVTYGELDIRRAAKALLGENKLSTSADGTLRIVVQTVDNV